MKHRVQIARDNLEANTPAIMITTNHDGQHSRVTWAREIVIYGYTRVIQDDGKRCWIETDGPIAIIGVDGSVGMVDC